MKRLGLFALIVVALMSLGARTRQPEIYWKVLQNSSTGSTKILDAVSMTASAATRTTEALDISGFSSVYVWADYTDAGATVTHITLTCQDGPTTAITGDHQSFKETGTDGTYDGSQQILRIPVSGSDVVRFVLTNLNAAYIKCTVGTAGVATANDVFDLYMRAGVI